MPKKFATNGRGTDAVEPSSFAGNDVVVQPASVTSAAAAVTAWAAAAMSNRLTVTLLRASVIGGPVVRSARTIWAAVAPRLALARSATAPATCGLACEVPLSVTPAPVMSMPGASRPRVGPDCEKQLMASTAGWASVHPLAQLCDPAGPGRRRPRRR